MTKMLENIKNFIDDEIEYMTGISLFLWLIILFTFLPSNIAVLIIGALISVFLFIVILVCLLVVSFLLVGIAVLTPYTLYRFTLKQLGRIEDE